MLSNKYSVYKEVALNSLSLSFWSLYACSLVEEIVKKVFFVLVFALLPHTFYAQGQSGGDAFFLKSIHERALEEGQAYHWLRGLCEEVGPRLAGSPGAAAAVVWSRQILATVGFDTVYLQACLEPRWVRGPEASAQIVNSRQIGSRPLQVTSLGNSIGTPAGGITAAVVEVQSLEELIVLGREKLAGKIVFFNRPMDPSLFNTFAAYGAAVDQRVYGASRAARFGAVGVVVRSMTLAQDDVPHTGTLTYEAESEPIPAIAISTNGANLLSQLLKNEAVVLHFESHGKNLPAEVGYNVIAEIKGSDHPEEIILVGGHLDSWDIGQGAHDDGAGCVQAMQVFPLLQRLGYRPKRTIRCVLFANEENGLAGAKAYWEASYANNEFHLLAIESDRGGFSPRGFSAQADASVFEAYYRQLNNWLPLLAPYGLDFSSGGSGADISGLKAQKGLLLGLVPDSQRYFDYHHTAADRLPTVHPRELALGAAAMTSLVYLIDQYGLQP